MKTTDNRPEVSVTEIKIQTVTSIADVSVVQEATQASTVVTKTEQEAMAMAQNLITIQTADALVVQEVTQALTVITRTEQEAMAVVQALITTQTADASVVREVIQASIAATKTATCLHVQAAHALLCPTVQVKVQ